MTLTTKSKKDLYVFNYAAHFCGEPLPGTGGTDFIVGGYGDDELQALTDAAEKLHGMGYRNLVITPR